MAMSKDVLALDYEAEATRIAGCDLHAPSVDVRARAVGARVHLDLDLEADRRTP